MPPVPVVSIGPDRVASSLGVRLYRVRGGVASPTTASPSPLVDDLGDSTVALRQLPAAAPGDRVAYQLFDSADPASAIYQGDYGPDDALPRALASTPAGLGPFFSCPFIAAAAISASFVVSCRAYRLAADPSPATATLALWRLGDADPVIASAAATVEVSSRSDGFILDLSATISSDLSATLLPGSHFARFGVVTGAGTLIEAPADESLRVQVYSASIRIPE